MRENKTLQGVAIFLVVPYRSIFTPTYLPYFHRTLLWQITIISSATKIQKLLSILFRLTKKELIYSDIEQRFDFYGDREGSSIFKKSLSRLKFENQESNF